MKQEEISLENLIPTSSSFKLTRFVDFEFNLKPCTGGILVEMGRKLGNIETLLSVPSAENISKLALMLMEYDSAVKFKKEKVKIIDVLTGDEDEIEMGGYKLLMHSIQGLKEQYDIYRCILQSLGYGVEQADNVINKLKDGMNKAVNDKVKDDSKKKSQQVK